MSGRLGGRSMLVTGGGSGIGRAVVRAYVFHGARVTVLERSRANAAALRSELGSGAAVVIGDATDADALDEAVSLAADDGPGLDQLTCCVGVHDQYATLREMDAAALLGAADEIWRVNVLSALLAVNRAYPYLRAVSGSVTLTLSESAFRSSGGGVLYGSSKWALRGVVSHLSKDLAPEVRVNGVAPGGTTDTGLGGLVSLGHQQTADRDPSRDGRIRSANALEVVPLPQDHAGAYLYLADPAGARVTTGVVINTDGGSR